jgi:asparagine synthase (glutamine-hydrolysing)
VISLIELLEKGSLPNESDWIEFINALESKTVPSNKQELEKALVEAIKKRIPMERFGILFSGGVDSSLIALVCRQAKADFACYSVGLKDSEDLRESEKAASLLGITLKEKIFSIEEAAGLFKETKSLTGRKDPVSIGVGSVILAAIKEGRKDNIKKFFTGLGSEEIFAGYERHALAKDKHEECWKGLKSMHARDLQRDYSIAKALDASLLVPFLDTEVIVKAMGIPAEKKINEEQKKIILREIAEELGLPKEIAWRKKRAAQYGSRFDWLLGKLAIKRKQSKTEFIETL